MIGRLYWRTRECPSGRRLLAEKPDLLAVLSDDAYLASLPVGSLGHAFRTFIDTNRLDAGVYDTKMMDAVLEGRDWDDEVSYLIKRGAMAHDLWHVLGGYGPDMTGEFGMLGLHCGQLEPAIFFKLTALIVGVFIPGSPRRKLRYFREGVQRGRRCGNMVAPPFEELLDKPIDEVRDLLGVPPTSSAHPGGHLFCPRVLPGMERPTRWDYDAMMRTV